MFPIIITLFSCILIMGSNMAQSEPIFLRFGFYTKDLGKSKFSEMDESLKRWMETIKSKTTVTLLASAHLKSTFYETKKSLTEGILSNKVDFMNFSTRDFYDLDLHENVIPMLAASKSKESKFEKYLLIANKNSAVNDISKLRNAQIVIPSSFSSDLIKIWLRVILKNKSKRSDVVSVEIVESDKKENETLFGIFFKKIEFAVVKEDSYLIACEINPQIKRNTKVIVSSPGYINMFLARRKGLDPKIYKEVIKIGLNLDETIEGKQILNLMQMSKMHAVNLADLKDTQTLIMQYEKLFRAK